jgi:outer membrane lipase/esterase
VDPGPGIGIGSGQVNSNLCTPSTIAAGREEYTTYLFADPVYPTPRGHQLFGDYAYDRIRNRF